MTAPELAAAIEAQMIDHPGCDDCSVLRLAAQRLRELEAVRHAALMLVQAFNNDASEPLLMALHDSLDEALRGVGGGA